MNRTKNAIRNIKWGFFQKIISLLLPFVLRTILIKVIGAEYLGLSSLFTSVLSLLSLAELGISSAIISTMYKPLSENDNDTICALMAFYRKAYHYIGTIILIAGLSIIPFLKKFIKGDVPSDINIYVLYIIYLFNAVISYYLFAYKNCLFIAYQRNDINSKIQTVCSLAQHLLQITLIVIFKNYYCFAIVIPVFSILVNLITAKLAKKEYPELVAKGFLNREIKNDVKQRVYGLMLGRISATIRSTIDSLFISLFLGLKAVAVYSNYLYIVTAVVGIIQTIETAIIAGVGNSIATDTKEKNHNDFLKFTFFLQWVVGWCSVCILCLEQPFMELWVGSEYLLDDKMVYLCALYLFINCICLIRSTYTQALGMWWALRYLSIFDIFANFFLNYILGKNFGSYGILAATIIDIAFVSIPWTTYFLYKNYFGIKKYSTYMFGYFKYLSIAVFAGSITYYLCSKIYISSNILTIVIRGIVCIILPNSLYIAVFRNNNYYKLALNILKKKISIQNR